jgi:hypothetical protein
MRFIKVKTSVSRIVATEVRTEFAPDSPLEGGGFELSVPGRETVKPPRGDEPSCLEKRADLFGNRRFESTSLQRRVLCEPTWSLAEVFRGDVVMERIVRTTVGERSRSHDAEAVSENLG